jgi:hypothetical protein
MWTPYCSFSLSSQENTTIVFRKKGTFCVHFSHYYDKVERSMTVGLNVTNNNMRIKLTQLTV